MNKSSIEKARAEFHGNEFGDYENPAPSPWAGILWLWALLVALGALVWLYGCTPAAQLRGHAGCTRTPLQRARPANDR